MNLFHSVYIYLHDARLKEGYASGSSPKTGNIVLAVCLMMVVFSVMMTLYLLLPGFADGIDDLLKDTFGRSSGKTIGRIIAIALILLIFPILKFTIGTKEKFYKTISEYDAMTDEDKEKTARKGKLFFILSLSSIAIPFIIGMLQ